MAAHEGRATFAVALQAVPVPEPGVGAVLPCALALLTIRGCMRRGL
jgi:hypothetical protein